MKVESDLFTERFSEQENVVRWVKDDEYRELATLTSAAMSATVDLARSVPGRDEAKTVARRPGFPKAAIVLVVLVVVAALVAQFLKRRARLRA